MWMSDRPRTQQQLALELAGLVDVIWQENVLPFLEAFWMTMAREWGGIDVLRSAFYSPSTKACCS
jgi:ribosomal RNA-processing protein 1